MSEYDLTITLSCAYVGFMYLEFGRDLKDSNEYDSFSVDNAKAIGVWLVALCGLE